MLAMRISAAATWAQIRDFQPAAEKPIICILKTA